jgi:hypothetical protein
MDEEALNKKIQTCINPYIAVKLIHKDGKVVPHVFGGDDVTERAVQTTAQWVLTQGYENVLMSHGKLNVDLQLALQTAKERAKRIEQEQKDQKNREREAVISRVEKALSRWSRFCTWHKDVEDQKNENWHPNAKKWYTYHLDVQDKVIRHFLDGYLDRKFSYYWKQENKISFYFTHETVSLVWCQCSVHENVPQRIIWHYDSWRAVLINRFIDEYVKYEVDRKRVSHFGNGTFKLGENTVLERRVCPTTQRVQWYLHLIIQNHIVRVYWNFDKNRGHTVASIDKATIRGNTGMLNKYVMLYVAENIKVQVLRQYFVRKRLVRSRLFLEWIEKWRHSLWAPPSGVLFQKGFLHVSKVIE